MSSTNNIECFYDYVIDKVLTERSISLSEITQETILSNLYDIFQNKISVSTILERIKERIALIQPAAHEDQINNAIPAVEEQASSEGMNLLVNQESNNENPIAVAVDDDMKDGKSVDMVTDQADQTSLFNDQMIIIPPENVPIDSVPAVNSEIMKITSSDGTEFVDLRDKVTPPLLSLSFPFSDAPIVTETVVLNPTEIGEPANLSMDPSVYQPKLSLNLPPEEEKVEDMNAEKAAVDLTVMEISETIQMSQHDFKPVSVPIPMDEPVSMEVDMEGGYFKDETIHNDQSSVLNQGTSSIPLQQDDAVVTLESGQLSQSQENIPATQESLSTMEVGGSQEEEGGNSMNAALIASRDSMFMTDDQPKRKKRKQRSAPTEEPIEVVHPYQTRKKGKSDGDVWTKYYEQLKVYYLKNNNCDVPVDFEVKVGTENGETLQLGIWLQQEKEKMNVYSAANPERHHLLTVWLSGIPVPSTSSTSIPATATAVSREVTGKQELSPSKGKRGRRAKAVQNEEETNIPKSSPPPPPNSLSASPLPIPSPTTKTNHEKHNSVVSSKSRGLTKSFETAQKEKQPSAGNSVNESSSTLLTPTKSSSAPNIQSLTSKNRIKSPSKPKASDNDSDTHFQQLLDKRQELLLEKAKKKYSEAPDGISMNSVNDKMIAFEYKKNNLFYIGLGKVKQVDLIDISGDNKKLTVVQKYMLSDPSNIEDSVAQETEELMQVAPEKIFSLKGSWVVFYLDPGNLFLD
jgi:hypothetical protein